MSFKNFDSSPTSEPPHIHIIVEVHSGIPIFAEAYSDETAALNRAEELRIDTNPENPQRSP